MFVDPQTTNLNFASSSANLKFTSFVIPLPEGTGKGAVMQRQKLKVNNPCTFLPLLFNLIRFISQPPDINIFFRDCPIFHVESDRSTRAIEN